VTAHARYQEPTSYNDTLLPKFLIPRYGFEFSHSLRWERVEIIGARAGARRKHPSPRRVLRSFVGAHPRRMTSLSRGDRKAEGAHALLVVGVRGSFCPRYHPGKQISRLHANPPIYDTGECGGTDEGGGKPSSGHATRRCLLVTRHTSLVTAIDAATGDPPRRPPRAPSRALPGHRHTNQCLPPAAECSADLEVGTCRPWGRPIRRPRTPRHLPTSRSAQQILSPKEPALSKAKGAT
jgi:hypothetical protein